MTRLWGLALLLLAGCNVLPEAAPPPKLYTLTPASDFPSSLPRSTWRALEIEVPAATASLDSTSILLSQSPTRIDRFAQAAWIDRAPQLVQALLVQSFENSGRLAAVGRSSSALHADVALLSELRHFEAAYGGAGPPHAVLELTLKLVSLPERDLLAEHRFEASVVATQNQLPEVVEAFDAALHQMLREVVVWTLAQREHAPR
ncbi:MAG TPA: ABC-type transport auxiliary lipoprotein family protein [Stellaceae bacterium]|nr:ABC-type transport auxiliary lipoprotein family protein [Stellaceae bacterium]